MRNQKLKTELATLEKASHSGGGGAIFKYKGRTEPKLKHEGKTHRPTWWSVGATGQEDKMEQNVT